MKGYILLADGMRLDGTLHGSPTTTVGWLAANTAVVGFQEMVTDPAYKDRILAFTYPEIGNVGVAKAFSESPQVQVAGLVIKVLSEYRSHYLSEDSFEHLLASAGRPILSGVDTRGLAVHLREKGEMAAAIASADTDPAKLKASLASLDRPRFAPSNGLSVPASESATKIAVINLGIRNSQLQQLARCCKPVPFPHDAGAKAILACRPKGIFVSDGPGAVLPPAPTVEAIKALLGKAPLLACGLGHIALGAALGCKPTFLRRGHHGANYPVRNAIDGSVEVTEQRHTVALDRDSVTRNPEVRLLWENLNDSSVEGICAAGTRATGLQATLAPPQPGGVNAHIQTFINEL